MPTALARLPLTSESLPAVGMTITGTVLGPRVVIKAGQILPLRWVPDDHVPPKHRAFVRCHVDRAALFAGIAGEVLVRWFEPAMGAADFTFPAERDDEIPAGLSPDEPNVIGLLVTLRGAMVPAVIAHEVRHVAQKHYRDLLENEAFVEEDANRFARAYLETEMSWCRVLMRSVKQDELTPEFYNVSLELSPEPATDCGITDTFTRVSASAWGTGDAGLVWDTSGSWVSSVDGSVAHGRIGPNSEGGLYDILATISTGPVLSEFVMSIKFKTSLVQSYDPDNDDGRVNMDLYLNGPNGHLYLNIDNGLSEWRGYISVGDWMGEGTKFAKKDWVADTWYVVEWEVIPGAENHARIYPEGTTPPDWQASYTPPSSISAFYLQLHGYFYPSWLLDFDTAAVTYSFDNLDIAGVNRCTS